MAKLNSGTRIYGNVTVDTFVTATGNVTGGNLITAGLANVGTLTVNGGSTFTGNLLPSANVTYNLGSPTQRWSEIYLAGNTIDIGGATISADLETGSLVLRGPTGAEFILTGSSPTDSFGIFGLIEAGNTSPATSTTTGALQVAGGAGIAGNIFAGGIVDIAGNSIYLGNLVLKDNGSNIFGLYAADGVTPATISQTSVDTTKISNGTSNVQVVSANANVTVSVGGTANVMVVSTAGANVLGTLGVSGNVTGGNLSGSLVTGTLTTAAQPNVTSVGTLTSVSVTGNVSGGNLVTTGTVSTGTLTTSGNATIAGNLTVSGNVISVNVTDLNVVDPIIGLGRGANNTPLTVNDGKDRGEQLWYYTTSEQSAFIGYDNSVGKLIAATNVSVSSEVVTINSYGNLVIGGLESATISATGNANVGNLGATTVTATTLAGTISTAAQPNVTSVGTLTSLAVTGNVTGGNLTTENQVIATGNVRGGNIVSAGQVVATGNISGPTLIASGNVVVQSRQQVKFYDTDNSNFISFRAPNALTGDFLLTLPTGYGNADQVLSTNGAGGLAWVDQSGGGGGSSATSYPNSTVQPVPGSTGNFDLSFNFVQTSQETPFESSATDPFGVNLGEVYSMMDPGGEILEPVDLGVLT
jgi:hypothetical protein